MESNETIPTRETSFWSVNELFLKVQEQPEEKIEVAEIRARQQRSQVSGVLQLRCSCDEAHLVLDNNGKECVSIEKAPPLYYENVSEVPESTSTPHPELDALQPGNTDEVKRERPQCPRFHAFVGGECIRQYVCTEGLTLTGETCTCPSGCVKCLLSPGGSMKCLQTTTKTYNPKLDSQTHIL